MKTQGSVLEQCISRFLILFGFLFWSPGVSAHPLVQYWADRNAGQTGLFFEPRVSFFSTSSNYDANGVQTPLAGSGSVTQYYLDLNLAYGITERFTLFGRLSGLKENLNGTYSNNASLFGLGEQLLGASYGILGSDSGPVVRLQVDASLPAYQNNNAVAMSELNRGDQTTDLTFGAFFRTPLNEWMKDLSAEAGAAYLFRTKGYSAAVPLNFFLQRVPSRKGFLGALGVRGQISLRTDTTPYSPPYLEGGSALLNAINPSWWLVQGSVGYRSMGGTAYTLSAGLPFLGVNSPGGFLLSLGVSFGFTPPAHLETRKFSQPTLFASYDLDAKVTSVNDQLYLVKIDHGSSDSVERGQTFDIFNGKDRTARARVINVKDDEAALSVIEYYQDHWVETGYSARRLVQ